MLQSFFTPFFTILLAEMLDKSQLTLIFLSTKTRRVLPLIVGSLLAFAIVDGTAIIFGSLIASIAPDNIVKLVAGLVFIIFGILSFRNDERENVKRILRYHPFVSAFLLIFLSEWGDKTQLASAAFATQFQPFWVFLGVMAAMTVLAILAVFAGRFMAEKINKNLIQKIAGVSFIGIGIYLLIFS